MIRISTYGFNLCVISPDWSCRGESCELSGASEICWDGVKGILIIVVSLFILKHRAYLSLGFVSIICPKIMIFLFVNV